MILDLQREHHQAFRIERYCWRGRKRRRTPRGLIGQFRRDSISVKCYRMSGQAIRALDVLGVASLILHFKTEKSPAAFAFYTCIDLTIGSGRTAAAGHGIQFIVAQFINIVFTFGGVMPPWNLSFLFMGKPPCVFLLLIYTMVEAVMANILNIFSEQPQVPLPVFRDQNKVRPWGLTVSFPQTEQIVIRFGSRSQKPVGGRL